MSDRSPILYLSEMLNAMEKVERYTAGISFEEFQQNEQLIDAVERNIEKIGEAAAAVPEDIRTRHAEIPWKTIVGLRNKVIHHYFAVDPEVIYQIATRNIPETKDRVAKVLEELSQQ